MQTAKLRDSVQILPSDFVTKSDGFLFMEEVYGRSFNNEYQLYLHRGLSDSKFEAAGGNLTYWQMGTYAPGLSQRIPPYPV